MKNPRGKIDLSALRVFVLDEADHFFKDNTREDEIMVLHQIIQQLKTDVQYVVFSTTFEKAVTEKLPNLISEGFQIHLKQE